VFFFQFGMYKRKMTRAHVYGTGGKNIVVLVQ
ncbi:MAG: hypothetical protein ACI8RD_008392, partial [Bacillariaceae sp.]